MLNEDPNLPFLGMAWSQSGMSEFFNQHVLPALCSGQAVFTGVAIEDMTYFTGMKCDILYSLQRGHPPVGNSVLAVVTFTRDSRAERIYARHYCAGVCSPVAATPGRAAYFPEYRCLVELFPDMACLGDTAVEVGNFIAALHKEVVRGQEYGRELASFFLAEYERCSGRDLVGRIRLFQAASLVRMAMRSFERSPYRYVRKGCDSLPFVFSRRPQLV